MNFYTIVSIIWVIFFFLFMGIIMIVFSVPSHKVAEAAYPGQKSQCPDFWSGDAYGNCFFPTTASFVDKTVKINAGLLTSLIADTNKARFSKDGLSFDANDLHWAAGGQSTVCAQRNWALQNRIVWDGVSNYNKCI